MRMSRRMGVIGGLGYKPTMAELFADATFISGSAGGFDSPSKYYLTPVLDADRLGVGGTAYCIHAVGGSLEISRLDLLDANTLSQTRLRGVAETGSVFTSSVSGRMLLSDAASYGYLSLVFRINNYSLKAVDYCFQNCGITWFKTYYSGTQTSSDTTLRVSKSTITGASGVVVAGYQSLSPSYSNVSISLCSSPLTSIRYYSDGNEYTTQSALYESGSYYLPRRKYDTNITASVNDYSLLGLYEIW